MFPALPVHTHIIIIIMSNTPDPVPPPKMYNQDLHINKVLQSHFTLGKVVN